MSERTSFANQIPTPKLDPLLMGEVMGSDAFSEGDWILLRSEENRPTKVICCHHDLIFVDHGEGEKFEDTLIPHYPEDLGYPLDHRFWSRHQKQCYLQCHIDGDLLQRWHGNTHGNVGRDTELKVFLLCVLASVIALAVSGLWMHYQLFRGFSDGINNPLNP